MGNEFFIPSCRDGLIFGVKDDLMKRGRDDHFTILFDEKKRITGHWTTNGEHHDHLDILETLREVFCSFLKSCVKVIPVDGVEKGYILFVALKQKLEDLLIQAKEDGRIIFNTSEFAKIAHGIEKIPKSIFLKMRLLPKIYSKSNKIKNLHSLEKKHPKDFSCYLKLRMKCAS